jgi:mannose-6-phosphate isomerase-like protein (cupin superfamily)
VLSGAAWVTVNGQDFVLKSGHVLQIPPKHCPVVISGLKQTALVYEIRY